MKTMRVPVPVRIIHNGTGAHTAETERRCSRCGKRIEDADDDRSEGNWVVCFWCAFVDPQG